MLNGRLFYSHSSKQITLVNTYNTSPGSESQLLGTLQISLCTPRNKGSYVYEFCLLMVPLFVICLKEIFCSLKFTCLSKYYLVTGTLYTVQQLFMCLHIKMEGAAPTIQVGLFHLY